MKHKVLLVEDETEIQEILKPLIESQSCDVTIASDGLQALNLINKEKFDFIVTDWVMPNCTGVELVKVLKSKKETSIPVLMLTAKSSNEDIIEGLRSGADDYATKPIDPEVFKARILSLSRRADFLKTTLPDEVKIDSLRVNFKNRDLSIGNAKVKLTNHEFLIFKALIEAQGKVVTKSEVSDYVYGKGYINSSRVIDVTICGLRKKLGKAGSWIESVHGVGYRVRPTLFKKAS